MRRTHQNKSIDMPQKMNKNVLAYADFEKRKRNMSVHSTVDFNFSPQKEVQPASTKNYCGSLFMDIPAVPVKKNIQDSFRDRAQTKINLCR